MAAIEEIDVRTQAHFILNSRWPAFDKTAHSLLILLPYSGKGPIIDGRHAACVSFSFDLRLVSFGKHNNTRLFGHPRHNARQYPATGGLFRLHPKFTAAI